MRIPLQKHRQAVRKTAREREMQTNTQTQTQVKMILCADDTQTPDTA